MSNFNYFAELAQARQSGIWTEIRNPRKDELIEAIAQHVEVKALEQEPVVIPAAVSYESLFKTWSDKKEEKTKRAKNEKRETKTVKQRGYQNALEVVQLLETFDYETVSNRLNKPTDYIKRAQRAHLIYLKSDAVKQWFNEGKIAWAIIHKAASSNPDKIDMSVIENKIKTLGAIQ